MKHNRAPRYLHTLLLSSLIALLPQTAHAFDKSLVAQFGSNVSQLVCSDRGEWLRCYRLAPASCQEVSKGFVEPCLESILSPITQQLTYDEGVAISKRLLNCFNQRFNDSYGAQKISSPECDAPPRHMQAKE